MYACANIIKGGVALATPGYPSHCLTITCSYATVSVLANYNYLCKGSHEGRADLDKTVCIYTE